MKEYTIANIADLIEDTENARVHDASNLSAIRASLVRFGQVEPLVVRKGTNVVIGGNGRLAVMRELGWTAVDVREIELSDTEAKALGLALNRTAELATWDAAVLRDHLASLTAESFDIGELGFDPVDFSFVDVSAHKRATTAPIETTEDDALPDLEEEPLPEVGSQIKIGDHTIEIGDCVEVLERMPSDSIDSIVTDPPYGIGFMGKGWDNAIPGEKWATECLRVLKPGGHLIAFAATRTVHRLGVILEDEGFEIRDMIAWTQWQGFPKSLDVSKAIDAAAGAEREIVGSYAGATNIGKKSDGKLGYSPGTNYPKVDTTVHITRPATADAKKWEGWGTALKPAIEPAILARKPLEGTVADNVLKWGTGGINIDGCRYPDGDPSWPGPSHDWGPSPKRTAARHLGYGFGALGMVRAHELGRWPANLYACPKPATAEREEGTENLRKASAGELTGGRKEGSAGLESPRAGAGRLSSGRGNVHPTVKPIRLMRWLVRLVTPPGGVVLDTFLGSGTTSIAAYREGVRSLGIELSPEYAQIAAARLRHATKQGSDG